MDNDLLRRNKLFFILPGKQKGLVVGGGVHLQNRAQSCPLNQSQAAFLEIPTPLAGFGHLARFTALPGCKGNTLFTIQQNTSVAPDVLFLLVLLCPSCETSKAEAGSSGDLTDLLQMKGPSHYKKSTKSLDDL